MTEPEARRPKVSVIIATYNYSCVLRHAIATVLWQTFRDFELVAVGPDGIKHTLRYEVMPDYLAIGSDDDFVRMPMNPYTAQAFEDAFGFIMPTRKMSNDIWSAASLHLDPRPLTVDRDSANTFFRSALRVVFLLPASRRTSSSRTSFPKSPIG